MNLLRKLSITLSFSYCPILFLIEAYENRMEPFSARSFYLRRSRQIKARSVFLLLFLLGGATFHFTICSFLEVCPKVEDIFKSFLTT